jgi:hypothetical protein
MICREKEIKTIQYSYDLPETYCSDVGHMTQCAGKIEKTNMVI